MSANKWRRGGLSRSHHSSQSSGQRKLTGQPCRFFSKGICRYGPNCKFSHDQQDPQPATSHWASPRAPAQFLDEDDDQDAFNSWRVALRQHPVPHLMAPIDTVWENALLILDGNSHQDRQQVVRDLVDDKYRGAEYLLYTLQMKLSFAEDSERLILQRFLQTITHIAILDCLSVETYVGTLYNMISGTGGGRAVAFFLRACESVLDQARRVDDGAYIKRYGHIVALMVTALHQLVIREKRVALHDDMPQLLARLDKVYHEMRQIATEQKVMAVGNFSLLATLHRIVDLASGLVRTPSNPGDGLVDVPDPDAKLSMAYTIGLRTPGGRHDNDHLELERISILPTAGELLSVEEEYLPSTDFRQPHFLSDPVQRYFDTHFRLLRHDVFGSLKSSLNPIIASLDDDGAKVRLPHHDLGVHTYKYASIEHIYVDKKFGLEISLRFSLPHQGRKGTPAQRRQWWENSRRLDTGVLLCFLSPTARKVTPLLLVAQKKNPESSKDRQNRPAQDNTAHVTAKLASLREDDLAHVIRLYRNRTQGVLVEVPGLIPTTVVPILANLQKAQRLGDLPFQSYIYTRAPGFEFDLSPITVQSSGPVRISAASSPNDESLLNKLETQTSLDRGQCRALLYALSQEFSLIQGPPGTGKSYLGVKLLQVLLGCREKANLGPIVIICYTNHALDQFLCHLLDVGITSIIRIGGQSRSPRLETHNLRATTSQMLKTRNESYLIGSTYSECEKQMSSAGNKLGTIHALRKGSDWKHQKRALKSLFPKIYRQVYQDEEQGYTLVGRDPLEVWINPSNQRNRPRSDMTDDSEGRSIREVLDAAKKDIHALTLRERGRFSDHLIETLENREAESLFVSLEEGERLRDTLDRAHSEVKRRALLEANVIGVTTTGFAKETEMLRKVRAKVVICEEAGEVLEAHVISAMMPGVEHFIQIGDHRQLRPQINNYLLSLESRTGLPYQLDRSQFERLAVGQSGLRKMPVAQLNIQRRMRPDIARLIRPIYPRLEDHDTVTTLPDVVGMKDNVFWLQHHIPEDGAEESDRVKSHSHEWEVGMTKALARHLVRQGAYKGSDIAVLTPYSGQLQKLRASLDSEFEVSISDRDEDVLIADGFEPNPQDTLQAGLERRTLSESLRLATVDNFQGEEAKVIIVSLVRSNPEGKVGFLRTENRINVLLSRAQHGMYLIGNSETYKKVPMWMDVQQMLSDKDFIGEAFNLCCPRHPSTAIQCSEPDDFLKNSPEGGCALPCDLRLDQCGHQCLAKCHSAAMHSVFSCPRDCPRRRTTCNHGCPKTCGEDCGRCVVKVDKVALPCGHEKEGVPCHKAQEPAKVRCEELVLKTVQLCGHKIEAACSTDVDAGGFRCSEPCTQVLKCGHACSGTCAKCDPLAGRRAAKHWPCEKRCGRPRNTCTHLCDKPCHGDEQCPPCKEGCEVLCVHSRCAQPCSEPCAPCIERCAWSCEHQGRCTMPCAAPCNRLPCNARCLELLKCGHQCPSICGETCPQDYCQLCNSKSDARVDLLEFKDYSEIDLDETPIVVLSCGHFFTAESLDGLVGLNSVYSVGKQGDFNGLIGSSEMKSVPRCPDCKTSIKQHATRRYNRVVNSAVMNETSKRFIVKGQQDLQELNKLIDKATTTLQEAAVPQLSGLVDDTVFHRYSRLRFLLRRSIHLCEAVGAEQQPSRKLFDAIIAAKAQESVEVQLANMGLEQRQAPAADHLIILGMKLAKVRIQEIIIHDQLSLLPSSAFDGGNLLALDFATSVKAFLGDCESIVEQSEEQKLVRLGVSATLAYARVIKAMQKVATNMVDGHVFLTVYHDMARELLEVAEKNCATNFQGSIELLEDVKNLAKLLQGPRYQTVSKEELDSIKAAMLGGPTGIATHSGHWYQCANGHPFAIGECGMPMEEARCPECGARIGGLGHVMVSGPTRAEHMEG